MPTSLGKTWKNPLFIDHAGKIYSTDLRRCLNVEARLPSSPWGESSEESWEHLPVLGCQFWFSERPSWPVLFPLSTIQAQVMELPLKWWALKNRSFSHLIIFETLNSNLCFLSSLNIFFLNIRAENFTWLQDLGLYKNY